MLSLIKGEHYFFLTTLRGEIVEKRVNYEDLIINLYIFNRLDRPSANMSTAKLLYLFEEKLFNMNMIGAHYQMKRHKWGPYNTKIGTNLKNLALNEYIDFYEKFYDKADKDVKIYFKNSKTSKFLNSIDDLLQEYSRIFNTLDHIIEEFGKLNAEELRDYLYSLEKTGIAHKRVIDYKLHSIILDPDVLWNPKVNFYLDDDWYDTVEIMLNPDMYHKIKKAIVSAQNGTFKLL